MAPAARKNLKRNQAHAKARPMPLVQTMQDRAAIFRRRRASCRGQRRRAEHRQRGRIPGVVITDTL